MFSGAGLWVSHLEGYVIQSIGDVGTALNPLMKEVSRQPGAWLANYHHTPLLWLAPALAYLGGAIVVLGITSGKTLLAFVGSSLACVSVPLSAGIALFPFILPSSTMPKSSLTAWDATSSFMTLKVMFWVAVIFTPIVLAYTSWAYHLMRGKLNREFIAANDKSLY